MQTKKIHDVIKPLCWIMGNWKSIKAVANYPTLECPIKYSENLSFISVGLPILNYTSVTWDPKDKSPMPPESGYLCIDKDGSSVALLVANGYYGITAIHEGVLKEKALIVKSTCIGHMKFGQYKIVALHRCYKLKQNGHLEYHLKAQTADTPLTEHISATYEKIEDEID